MPREKHLPCRAEHYDDIVGEPVCPRALLRPAEVPTCAGAPSATFFPQFVHDRFSKLVRAGLILERDDTRKMEAMPLKRSSGSRVCTFLARTNTMQGQME